MALEQKKGRCFYLFIDCFKKISGKLQNFRLKKMHFPYYLLVNNQWFEKLTKGTALGGLSPLLINHPLLINPCRKIFQFFGR